MKKLKFTTIIIAAILSAFVLDSCTNLEEFPKDKVTSEVLLQDPSLVPNLIAPALGQVRFLWYREGLWGMQEVNTDEAFFPTRGTDWFDGGVWQEHALHTWTPIHRDVSNVWNQLNEGVAAANFGISVLGTDEDVSTEIKEYRAMLHFLRGFYMFHFIDVYGLSPYRDAFNTDYKSDPEYLSREVAFNFIVSDIKSIIDDMPDRAVAEYGIPTKDAGLMLLAKLYLNKEVYTGEAAWDSCQMYLDQVIESGNYNLADNYFNMFKPDNHLNYRNADDEGIFVIPLDDSDEYGMNNTVIWVQHAFHYNQQFNGDYAGWNGMATTEDFLENVWFDGTDITTDVRFADSTVYPHFAVVSGFNMGQQYNTAGEALTTRGGDPLDFTPVCPLEDATENQGVRVLKYAPRIETVNVTRISNDFMIYRYADALLMKAECLQRTGDNAGALKIINQIREKRKAPTMASLSLLDILDERGRELYYEGHRRTDMIRFGTFLNPRTIKNFTSPSTALILPVPQTAIEASDGLLEQNPGY